MSGGVVGPAEKAYTLGPRGETAVDWDILFTDEFLAKGVPVHSTYNNTGTFGVRTARLAKGPGRKPAAKWTAVDYPCACCLAG